jgi:pseudouridine-5'-phosphate glycosidase
VLIANPVPREYEVHATTMEAHIREALASAEKKQIRGKAVTPFLLKHIAEHTRGESLEANIALIENNAACGAEIAVAYQLHS